MTNKLVTYPVMELIACICIIERNIPMHVINALHRLTKYTVAESRYRMRVYKIRYAVYQCRFAHAIQSRIHRFAVSYNSKYSITYQPAPSTCMWVNQCVGWSLPSTAAAAFRDVTIFSTERIYMPGATPTCSWLTIDGVGVACVRMIEIACTTNPTSTYKYRMRLPTRYNPLCECCVGVNRIGIILESGHIGLRPAYELKKIIVCIKIKFYASSENQYHSNNVSYPIKDLFTRTISTDVKLFTDYIDEPEDLG